jgi:hypothetical protein
LENVPVKNKIINTKTTRANINITNVLIVRD